MPENWKRGGAKLGKGAKKKDRGRFSPTLACKLGLDCYPTRDAIDVK
jgi:hypothetical protein